METSVVSVIILNYNGRPFLGSCLRSVLGSRYAEYEIMVVDNASVDGSIEYMEQEFSKFDRLRIVRLKKNYGFAVGNNMGYENINPRSKYVVFLNNDTEVEPDWLHNLVEKMDSDPLIGAAQPKIRCLTDRTVINTVGGEIDYYGRATHIGTGEIDHGQYDSITEIFYAEGAAIALRKEVLEKVGLFDALFFTYYEETDLCWRIWLAGYKVVLISNAIVYHLGGATISREAKKNLHKAAELTIYNSRRNQLIMMLKNYSAANIVRYVIPFTIRIFAVALMRLVENKGIESLAYLRALWSILVDSPQIVRSRRHVQKDIRELPDVAVMRLMKMS